MNFIKYRFVSFIFSGVLVLISLYGLIRFGLVLGVDFTGGSLVEVALDQEIEVSELKDRLTNFGLVVSQIQQTGSNSLLVRFEGNWEEKSRVLAFFEAEGFQILRFETVGPTFGRELFRKALLAIGLTIILILFYIAWRFKDINFGLVAVLAMVHDNLILLGSFSILGQFFGSSVDSLFVTAALTTLATSVYDTVVTFGYIKDQLKQSLSGRHNIEQLANEAINATIVRNINNSWTIIFMLVAILLLGGETVRWFSSALLIGTLLGTYSSTFLAVPLLVSWQKIRRPQNKT
ncbi:MAG: protein translocase subunit SecF [Candidatus Shapirobacteria bacterium]|nr:protein translocase subunit SecF [Candidatus Shapirobacteria bacterium]